MTSHINSSSASISVSTLSARTAYPQNHGQGVIRVYNAGSVPVFLRSGNSSVTATTSSQFLGAGETYSFVRNPSDTNLAAITASGTSTVYFSMEG